MTILDKFINDLFNELCKIYNINDEVSCKLIDTTIRRVQDDYFVKFEGEITEKKKENILNKLKEPSIVELINKLPDENTKKESIIRYFFAVIYIAFDNNVKEPTQIKSIIKEYIKYLNALKGTTIEEIKKFEKITEEKIDADIKPNNQASFFTKLLTELPKINNSYWDTIRKIIMIMQNNAGSTFDHINPNINRQVISYLNTLFNYFNLLEDNNEKKNLIIKFFFMIINLVFDNTVNNDTKYIMEQYIAFLNSINPGFNTDILDTAIDEFIKDETIKIPPTQAKSQLMPSTVNPITQTREDLERENEQIANKAEIDRYNQDLMDKMKATGKGLFSKKYNSQNDPFYNKYLKYKAKYLMQKKL